MVEHAAAPAPDQAVRQTLAEVPTKLRERLPNCAELLFGHRGEVFALQPFDLGSGFGSIGDFDVLALPFGFFSHERNQARSVKLLGAVSRRLGCLLRLRYGSSRLPKLAECTVEELEILVTIDQGGAGSLVDLVSVERLDPGEGLRKADHLVDADGKAESSQPLGELDQSGIDRGNDGFTGWSRGKRHRLPRLGDPGFVVQKPVDDRDVVLILQHDTQRPPNDVGVQLCNAEV